VASERNVKRCAISSKLGGDLPRDEIENLALTAGERHNFSRTETEA